MGKHGQAAPISCVAHHVPLRGGEVEVRVDWPVLVLLSGGCSRGTNGTEGRANGDPSAFDYPTFWMLPETTCR